MHRRVGLAFAAALAFAGGLTVAACGQGDAPEAAESAAGQAIEAAQTTPATRPVVTVYKSPT